MATGANCGAPFESATRFCVHCGRARDDVPVPRGFVRVGPTLLPVWLVAVIALLAFAGSAGATYLLTSSPAQQRSDAPSGYSQPLPDPTPPDPTAPGPDPTTPAPDPTTPDPTTPAPADTTPAGDPAAVVRQYYADLNAQDYQDAWQLGADNFAGTSFDQWKSGFAGTVSVQVQADDDPSDPSTADVVIDSLQSDGSTQHYTGTYSVEGGLIVAASVH